MAAVVADDVTGITEAFSHLRQLGHHRIGHLAGPSDMSTGTDRAPAFDYCASSAGLGGSCPIVECDEYTRESGARAMEVLMGQHPGITAVVAGNDLIALGAIETLRNSGRHCPDDVSVVGFNDMPYLDLMTPPLTTVRVSHYDLGFEAARMLVEMLRRPAASRRLVLPTQLVVRQSTAAPRRRSGNPSRRGHVGSRHATQVVGELRHVTVPETGGDGTAVRRQVGSPLASGAPTRAAKSCRSNRSLTARLIANSTGADSGCRF